MSREYRCPTMENLNEVISWLGDKFISVDEGPLGHLYIKFMTPRGIYEATLGYHLIMRDESGNHYAIAKHTLDQFYDRPMEM